METSVSISSYDLNPRISRQVRVAKVELSKQTDFDVSQKKAGKASAAHIESMTMQSLYTNSLFQETTNIAPPRQRYKRRNSAIASMLLSSVTAAATCDSREPVQSLRLSTALRPSMNPSEALAKAEQLLKNLPDSPPALREISVMQKRASTPWCQKYYVPTDREIEQSRKRQRTSEYVHS
mmetsp:Transcript_11953/g.19818  ORF Transcript_11953/g.19818 Transcript_11953/m.19818 type:complete len:180 (-) Transcript_11953:175-714(-)|eukprot:CAMPEP_0119012560 /NCGR_PEP_ID=MMETSP1176-20130426/6947_1 /TAXON_ID=265551 /ORGANISM="Synedropsis recta cf, Strain CCMP1620" /LENGTH=179 /DNA_ID=CAMNT_0006965543 /DNA_START=77 /DNA_END=616 /DNA_ORIENTATION=+